MHFEYAETGQMAWENGMVKIYGNDNSLQGCISMTLATLLYGVLWGRRVGEDNEHDRLMMESLWAAIKREDN